MPSGRAIADVVPPQGRLEPATIWPRARWHWLPATIEVLEGLATLSDRHAEREICDHLHAVSGGKLVLVWHDAFDGPLLVTEDFSGAHLSAFARAVSVEPIRRNAGPPRPGEGALDAEA